MVTPVSKMEAKLDDLNACADYLNTTERGVNKMFNDLIDDCAEKLENFISFIKFITQNKSHCRRGLLWRFEWNLETF